MQLSHILSVLAVASFAVGIPLNGDSNSFAEGVEARDLMKRSCDSGDKTWGDNSNHAIDRAGRWCSGDGGSGEYRAGLIKSGCYNAQFGSNHYAFHIQNTNVTPQTLDPAGCNTFMQEQINNCPNGGEGERDGWYFR